MNVQPLNRKLTTLLFVLICNTLGLLISLPSLALGSEISHENEEIHDGEFVLMPDKMAQSVGVVTQKVQAGRLNITMRVYGNIVTDPASLSHIRARFDGLVTQVNTNLGNKVKKGATLALVESNESLKSYPVAAPFSGIVIARHANEGELSNGQVLFSIANYEGVWAQLKVFPKQLADISPQQKVQLNLSQLRLDTFIHHILPSPDEQPYVLAYAKIDNRSGRWPVGAAIKGQVTTQNVDVAMLLPKTAIQQYEGASVVFVKVGDKYRPQPVTLGKQDIANIEVLAGLDRDDVIVSQNSYLLKADLEKSEAAHAH
ncbi:MAG: cobalt-zinc-cadmium efflux system membrane fusion protein [Paraglaciecola sp.]|jgi:cobalt-zinc-cadmium efflux system membrane fusion protein